MAGTRDDTLVVLDHNRHVQSDMCRNDQLVGTALLRNLWAIVVAPSPTSGFSGVINWAAMCFGRDSHALFLGWATLIYVDEVHTQTELILAGFLSGKK